MKWINSIKKALGLNKEQVQVTPFFLIGGQEGIDKLVDGFYYYMDTLSEAKKCRDLHQKSLDGANMKLKMFLSGWFGGPSVYIEKYGHPKMRMRHMPFIISEIERDEWLLCMRKSMDDMNLHPELDEYLDGAFKSFC